MRHTFMKIGMIGLLTRESIGHLESYVNDLIESIEENNRATETEVWVKTTDGAVYELTIIGRKELL